MKLEDLVNGITLQPAFVKNVPFKKEDNTPSVSNSLSGNKISSHNLGLIKPTLDDVTQDKVKKSIFETQGEIKILKEETKRISKIPNSVKKLYFDIGEEIGLAIKNRMIEVDTNLGKTKEIREKAANQVINTIMAIRKELANGRDFDKIDKAISGLSTAQMPWFTEAWLLLNQSSAAAVQAAIPESQVSPRVWAEKLIDGLSENGLSKEDLFNLFGDELFVGMVMTAHPTACIKPDYLHHIEKMVGTVKDLVAKTGEGLNIKAYLEQNPAEEKEFRKNLATSISHMVRANPYNELKPTPIDESKNFLASIKQSWNIIPERLYYLEEVLREKLGVKEFDGFLVNPNALTMQSWVARDIDGNYSVGYKEHTIAVMQERKEFLEMYLHEAKALKTDLTDDFSKIVGKPEKTSFKNEEFKELYEDICESKADTINANNKNNAYQVVLQHKVIKPLETEYKKLSQSLENLEAGLDQLQDEKQQIQLIRNTKARFGDFDIEENFIKPLMLIRSNKQGLHTKEIDIAIKKAQVFGGQGSKGHTRQLNSVLTKLAEKWTGLELEGNTDLEERTNFVLSPQNDNTKSIDDVWSEIEADKEIEDNIAKRMKQALAMFDLNDKGGIQRQIISMNQGFGDMLNVLTLAKQNSLFKPGGGRDELPESKIEIVPLTEEINKLRTSYQCLADALANPAWRQHIIARGGVIPFMNGPSDSGKQNGFPASQWEITRSNELNGLVIRVYNSFLLKNVFKDDFEYESVKLLKEKAEKKNPENRTDEDNAVLYAFNLFNDSLSELSRKDNVERAWWIKANDKYNMGKKVKLVNFAGVGGPIERGNGRRLREPVELTTPEGFSHYERTIQGGSQLGFMSELTTQKNIQDLLEGAIKVAARKVKLEKSIKEAQSTEAAAKILEDKLYFKPDFVETMKEFIKTLRMTLRNEFMGIDLDDDNKIINEERSKEYSRAMVKSPLVFLDWLNIASRPTNRSGAKLKEAIEGEKYDNDIDEFIAKMPQIDRLKMSNDARAIPYVAMFSLLGGNHTSYVGYSKLLNKSPKMKKIMNNLIKYYKEGDTQESRLLRHIINTVEEGLLTNVDPKCYKKAREIIEKSTDPEYNVNAENSFENRLINEVEATNKFIATVKGYESAKKKNVKVYDLKEDQPKVRDLWIARRNDAASVHLANAKAIAGVFAFCKNPKSPKGTKLYNYKGKKIDLNGGKPINPLDVDNVPMSNYHNLCTSLAASGSTNGGDGCMDS